MMRKPLGSLLRGRTDTELQRRMCGGHQHFSSEKSGTRKNRRNICKVSVRNGPGNFKFITRAIRITDTIRSVRVSEMVGIRFHGRGGQGAVVASKILATAYFKCGA